MQSYNREGFTQWIVLVLVALMLGGLLFIKFTGRQDIFSYQGIRSTTPGFGLYNSGVQSINSWLKYETGDVTASLKQGIQFLQDAYSNTQDKQLLQLLSGQLEKAKSLDFINTTTTCFDILQSWFITMGGILDQYETLTSGFQSVNKGLQEAISVLPASATKECLTKYKNNLKNSLEGLVLTYKNIDVLSQQYDFIVGGYTKVLGSCESLQEILADMDNLYIKLKTTNDVITSVQKHLDANDVEKYNELCGYGTIQWLSGLQVESRRLVKSFGALTAPALQKVNNVSEYIEELQQQIITISGDDTKKRWQQLFQ